MANVTNVDPAFSPGPLITVDAKKGVVSLIRCADKTIRVETSDGQKVDECGLNLSVLEQLSNLGVSEALQDYQFTLSKVGSIFRLSVESGSAASMVSAGEEKKGSFSPPLTTQRVSLSSPSSKTVPITPLSVSTASAPLTPKAAESKDMEATPETLIEANIKAGEYEQAYKNLRLLFSKGTYNTRFNIQVYAWLGKLLPRLDLAQIHEQEGVIRSLLKHSEEYPGLQITLAVQLAERHEALASSGKLSEDQRMKELTTAMHYYAKGIIISELQGGRYTDPHAAASELLVSFVCSKVGKGSLFRELEKALSNPKQFEAICDRIIARIGLLTAYSHQEKTYKELIKVYGIIRDDFILKANKKETLQSSSDKILQVLANPYKMNVAPYVTIGYREELRAFRAEFKKDFDEFVLKNSITDFDKVGRLQKIYSEKFAAFMQSTILADATLMMGFETRAYDLRVLGSFARKEICPYSDIEWMLLIRDEKELPDFIEFAELFILQLISLGETAACDLPVFGSIGKTHQSGLHNDWFGHLECIGVPKKLAECQKRNQPHNVATLTTPENLFLNSLSLQASDDKLFTMYEEELKQVLPDRLRAERALLRMKLHRQDYLQRWPKPIDLFDEIHLKNQYVDLLNFLMLDFGLYFKIPANNTLDIIQQLTLSGVFSKESGILLSEAAAAVYMVRVRLQFAYKEQKETASMQSGKLESLTATEKEALSQAYWLVLAPLYLYIERILITKTQLQIPIHLPTLAFRHTFYISDPKDQKIALERQTCFIKNHPCDLHKAYTSYLQDFGFQAVPASEHFTLFSEICAHAQEKVFFSYCSTLTDVALQKFLLSNGKKIKVLDLSGCAKITGECLVSMDEYCPNLEELCINRCDGIRQVTGRRPLGIFKRATLTFSKLKRLSVNQCKNLEIIRIKAELLTTINANENPSLVNTEIESSNLIYKNFNKSPKCVLIQTGKVPLLVPQAAAESEAKKPETAPVAVNGDQPPSYQSVVQFKPAEKEEKLDIPNFAERLPNYTPFFADSADLYMNPFPVVRKQEEGKAPETDDSIEQIFTYVEQAEKSASDLNDKEVLSLIGNTGSGKSTMTNCLLGCEMTKKGRHIIAENAVAKIGLNRDVSETSLPQCFPMEKSNQVVVDMPGFLDSRGPQINIANSVIIPNFLNKAKSNRLLFLINSHTIDGDKGYFQKNVLGTLVKFFGSVDALNQNMGSVLIGITHTSAEDFKDYKADLIERIKDWNLAKYQDQIIHIDPLRKGLRDEIFGKLQQLSPIKDPKGCYKIALTSEDELLISKITENASKQISRYLDDWNIDGVIREYQRLVTLSSLPHSAILSVIGKIQYEIGKLIDGLVLQIQATASKDSFEARRHTIQNLLKLELCCKLDFCFNPSQQTVSNKYEAVRKEVQGVEAAMQMATNQRVEKDLGSLLPHLGTLLKALVKTDRKQLFAFNASQPDVLERFSKQFQWAVTQDLQSLFAEIGRETQLRPNKYFFKNLVPLDGIQKQEKQKVGEMLVSACNEAKILELQEQFKNAYAVIFNAIAPLVAKQCQELCKNRPNLTSLSNFGFDQVDQLIGSLNGLKALINTAEWNEYEALAQKLVTTIYTSALTLSIDQLLAKELDDEQLAVLNAHFKNLSSEDEAAFKKASQKARSVFVERPQKEIQEILSRSRVNQTYQAEIKAALNKFKQAHFLPGCFPARKGLEEYAALEQEVQTCEARRRKENEEQFEMKLARQCTEAKTLIKNFTTKNFSQIPNPMAPHGLVACLSQLTQMIPDLAALKDTWLDLEAEINQETNHYYFQLQNSPLLGIKNKYSENLNQTFRFIELYAKGLQIQTETKQRLAKLKSEFFPKILSSPYKLDVPSTKNIHIEPISKFEQEVADSSDPILKELCQEVRKEVETTLLEIEEETKKRNAAPVLEQLRDAGETCEFYKIVDEIPNLFKRLKNESPASCQEAETNLLRQIGKWLTSNSLAKDIGAKNYFGIGRDYATARKLKEIFPAIDITKFNERLIEHVRQLKEQALNEIKCLNPNIFSLSELNNIITVIDTLANYGMNTASHKQNLIIAVRERNENILKDCISLMQSRIASAELNARLAELSAQLMKSYGMTSLLSLEYEFRALMKEIFKQMKSSLQVVQIERTLMAFSTKPTPESAWAKALIDQYPEFNGAKRELFSKKDSIDFDKALRLLNCAPVSKGLNKLQKAYQAFDQDYKTYLVQIVEEQFDSDGNIQKIKKVSTELSSYATQLSAKPELTARLLAAIFAQWTCIDSRNSSSKNKNNLLKPHSTQVLAIFRLIGIDAENQIENHLIELKTGEGKSISLGITAALFALLGYQVNVTCYSSYLSDRDEQAFSGLFSELGLVNQISYSTFDQLVRKMMKTHFPDFCNYVLAFLQGKPVPKTALQARKSLLLLDEVDVFFGEKFYGQLSSWGRSIPSKNSEKLMLMMWKEKKRLTSMSKREAIEELMKWEETQEILNEYPNLHPFLPKQFESLLNALNIFPDQGGPTQKFNVQNNRVYSLDNAGNQVEYLGYNYMFAYLYYKEKGKIQISDADLSIELSMFMRAAQVLYSEVPKFFHLKLGLTGTLTSLCKGENKILDDYGFTQRTTLPSTFDKKQKLVEEETVVIPGTKEEEYYSRIKEEIDSMIRKNRACLVVFATKEQVEDFSDHLKNLPQKEIKYTAPQCLTEDVPDSQKPSIIAGAITQFKATLITRTFGRGTDFVCYDSALRNCGGIHIILTFYPETLTEEIQIRGRTCRQDDPGSIRKILFAGDLLNQGFVPAMKDNSRLPDLHECLQFSKGEEKKDQGDKWENYLKEKREKKYLEQMQDMERALARNMADHTRSMDLAEAIREYSSKKTPALRTLVEKLLAEVNYWKLQ